MQTFKTKQGATAIFIIHLAGSHVILSILKERFLMWLYINKSGTRITDRVKDDFSRFWNQFFSNNKIC